MTKATLPNEVREAMARAISRTEHDTLQVGGVGEGLAEYDPEAAFDCYIDHVDAALAALEAAGWELNRKGTLEEVVDAAYAKGRADALEEAAQMAEVDARAISKGTYGRMGSTTAIGDHIAQAIRAIASIESAAMLTASRPKEQG